MKFKKKDIVSIKDLSKEEIEFILQQAKSFKEINQRAIKKVPTLRGKTIVTCFYEPSTRTRLSFEIFRLHGLRINITQNHINT